MSGPHAPQHDRDTRGAEEASRVSRMLRGVHARPRFLALLRLDDGVLHAHDPWRPDAAPVRYEGDAQPGDWAQVECDGAVARGEVYAPAGSALARLVRIAADHGLDPVFPDAVLDEVEALWDGASEAPPGTDDPSLADLTDLPFVTIDNEGSRDLDQALHIARDGAGHRVRYALADASFYVRPGTALWDEALARGASFYLPGWMVPMLPRRLSEGLVSLNPGVDRRALVFDMRLDASGRSARTAVIRARIRSRAKLTYDGVQAALDGAPGDAAPWDESLHLLAEVGARRIADATERDVVRHRRRSVEVGLEGLRSFVLYGGMRNDVERYNEQLSLLCNVEGAKLIAAAKDEAGMQAIFRVHPSPPAPRVEAFRAMTATLAAHHGIPAWPEDQSLAAYLAALPWEGEAARASRAIQRQAILMNVRSTFSDEAAGHHGVGAEVYARFSSPMREIVGVFLHKELWESLHGESLKAPGAADDEALQAAVIEAANRSKALQRRLTALGNRLAIDELFERDLASASAPTRRGTVMGLTNGKLHLQLDEPPIDVKLYRTDLEAALGRTLRLTDDGAAWRDERGEAVARTGDALDVRVSHRDVGRDRWVLVPDASSLPE